MYTFDSRMQKQRQLIRSRKIVNMWKLDSAISGEEKTRQIGRRKAHLRVQQVELRTFSYYDTCHSALKAQSFVTKLILCH